MARKGGKRGGSSAARSAAAKKGWETRRRGGAAKPATPSKPRATPKTTTARGRARTAETRARAAVRAGGGTKATRSLLTAQRARDYYKTTGTGKKRSRSGTRTYGPANGIRPTTGPRRAPFAGRSNAIRTYNPATARGKHQLKQRQIRRATNDVLGAARNLLGNLRASRSERDALLNETTMLQRKLARRTARDIADRSKPGIKGRLAQLGLQGSSGQMIRNGKAVIRRRAIRAARAAARGSKPAARASQIYDNQLANTGTGKPSTAKSGIRPGPRNTTGKPKKKRKPRKR
jgi:hypothetical protein